MRYWGNETFHEITKKRISLCLQNVSLWKKLLSKSIINQSLWPNFILPTSITAPKINQVLRISSVNVTKSARKVNFSKRSLPSLEGKLLVGKFLTLIFYLNAVKYLLSGNYSHKKLVHVLKKSMFLRSPFRANVPFLYPLKTPENQRFSIIFEGVYIQRKHEAYMG